MGEGKRRTEPTNERTVVPQHSNTEREKAGSVLCIRNQVLYPASGKGPAGRQRLKTKKESLTKGGQGGRRLRQAVLGAAGKKAMRGARIGVARGQKGGSQSQPETDREGGRGAGGRGGDAGLRKVDGGRVLRLELCRTYKHQAGLFLIVSKIVYMSDNVRVFVCVSVCTSMRVCM